MATPPGRPAPGPRGAGLLTGPDVTDILNAALQEAGGNVESWRANQVDHQPGRGSSAAYQARVRWADGQVTEERFGAYTGTAPAGTLTVGNGTDRVAVWRFPHDPYLPGLAAAYDPAAVSGLLRSFGLGSGTGLGDRLGNGRGDRFGAGLGNGVRNGLGTGEAPVRLVLRSYRPRRRAVVEAVGPGGRLFVKVVRPDRVEALHRRHRLLSDAGVPAAPSLGHTPDGLLVLQALPGQTLRQALRSGTAQPLPSGEAILNLLDRLPEELAEGPARRSWRDRAEHYAAVLADLLPRQATRVRQIGNAILADAGVGPTVPIHGDFYESQLRISGDRISGLLDIDTAGPGERLDDLACLLGHLSVLAQLDPAQGATIGRLGARYLAAFERSVDPVDLRYRIAAVVLSLATGPHRVQEPGWQRVTRSRIELAERWLDSAHSLGRAQSRG